MCVVFEWNGFAETVPEVFVVEDMEAYQRVRRTNDHIITLMYDNRVIRGVRVENV